ncbi:glycosyltransferase family 2 protein [Paenibacillus aestuarii]|uniref:Glycosyltransferase family A protein n=1 Tax=Paenibacillus aestuarii TaxID=516965 RepID=A0ABW0K8Y6_9BACL|nr:glycosyltransferase family A protein [Paenibacillus aestuarii]
MSTSQITVVIPVYNREKYIEKALNSVLKQTYTQWQMIIINDGSTDKTGEIIKRFTDEKRIRHIQYEKNRGTGKALQSALKEIQTPYFVILDSDDWFEPDTLKVLVKEMDKQPETTSLICANSNVWKERVDKTSKVYLLKNRSFQDKYDFLRYGPAIYPRCMRTATVRRVGGFANDDPHGGRFDEDRYLLLKLIGISNFHWIDKTLYNVLTHEGNTTRRENRKYFKEAKKYIFTKILKQWGDEYEPVFAIAEDGWLYIKKLKPKKEGVKRIN